MHEEGINDDGEWLECVCGGGEMVKATVGRCQRSRCEAT